MSAAVVQRLDLDVERSEVPVAVLVLDARVGKLDVAVVVRELVLDGPTMDLFRRSIGPSVALGLATIALLQELLVLALQLVVEDDATDEGALFAQPLGILEVGAIDLRVVHQLARPVHGETGVARTSDAGVELLPGLRLLGSAALVVNVAPVAELLLHARQLAVLRAARSTSGCARARPVLARSARPARGRCRWPGWSRRAPSL